MTDYLRWYEERGGISYYNGFLIPLHSIRNDTLVEFCHWYDEGGELKIDVSQICLYCRDSSPVKPGQAIGLCKTDAKILCSFHPKSLFFIF